MFRKILQKRFFKDSFWTMLALCILNVTIQLLVYPFLNRVLGAEEYGNTLTLISIINIAAVSFGISVNNRRMIASATSETQNGEYNLFLFIVSILLLPVCFFLSYSFHILVGTMKVLLFWLLMCVTIWRYYADVEFRLNLNYKGYFIYYLLISIGYLLGMVLYRFSREWTLVLLPGEMLGLFYIFWKGSIFTKDRTDKMNFGIFLNAVVYLIGAQLLIQLVFNADRLVLKFMCGGVSVTVYYIASLMGKTIALLTTPLNSVIIGYLARSKEDMTARRWVRIVGLCMALGFIILAVCVVASHIVIRILYPQEYNRAAPLFVLANLAQIVYFVTGILTTILLRYMQEKYQLSITVVYAIVFLLVVFPVTKIYGLWGFSYSILFVNVFRFLYVFYIMLRKISKSRSKESMNYDKINN